MSFNIYKTKVMLQAMELMVKRATFLRDRYFPHNASTDLFPSEEVLIEIRKGNRKIAPAVMPRKGGITMEREGYRTDRYEPPYIAPQRVLTIDILNKKGFGESLFSNITPEQRQADILRQDLMELQDLISGREEFMAASALLNNGYILKHYADSYGAGNYEEWELRFYEGSNPSIYTPDADWDEAEAKIIEDLAAMIKLLTTRGLAAEEALVAGDVAEVMINSPRIQNLFDIKNMNFGKIEPTVLPSGAASLGKININGRMIEILTYDETYEDETTGENIPFITPGHVIVTAPACGRTLYGAVTQIESDESFHTYMGARVPKYISDRKTETREIKVTSRPLLIPKNETPWIVAKVINA